MSQPSRRFLHVLLVFGAVVFGMVLAGGLELTPVASSNPAQAVSAPASAAVSAGFPDFASLAAAVDPAVVSIQAATIESRPERQQGQQGNPFDFFFGPRGPRQRQQPQRPQPEDQQFRQDAGGSGFIVSADGLVVTNLHVIKDATEVKVLLEGREYKAEVRGTDPATDIALLKIDAGSTLPYLKLGNSDETRVGEWVMAVGSPLGLERSVTVGVVSAKGRSIGIADVSFENFIQTDAAINFGNSGGPLINLRGEVIGINTAINYGADNIGFAVPSNTVNQVLPQLRESGKVRRGYLGLSVRNLDFAAAEAYGLSSPDGALVAEVVKDQPAAKAGLRAEDIVVKVDDRPVKTTRDLIDYVSAKGPDATVVLDVLRNGSHKRFEVKLAERSNGAEEVSETHEDTKESGVEWLGIRYQDLSPSLRGSHGVPEDVKGVWITSVSPSSPLYEDGVRADNVINIVTSVNGEAIADVQQFERVVKATKPGSRLRLYIRRFVQGEEQQPVLSYPAVP